MEAQNSSMQSVFQQQQVLKGIKVMNHFSYDIPLPPTATIFTYAPKRHSESKKKKKIKNKFDSFSYYQFGENKIKILFVNDNTFVDQGQYPFTDPSGKERLFSEINGKRLKITQAAYIGHVEDNLIVKKMQGVKVGEDGSEVETVDDNFELIKIGNVERFSQFMKFMSINKNSIQLSIRVIIDQTDYKNVEVIDYEFFYREKQLMEKHKLKGNQLILK